MTEFHRNEIKQILDQEYSCNVCNYKTKLKGSMKQHNESIHGSTFYSCDQCNYKFWMKEWLNAHIRVSHEETCYTCDKIM